MTVFFLFARSNLSNVLIRTAKKFFHSDFPFPCFDVPKASNFTSGGVQNRETKNRGLGTIVTSIQDSKPREKQISPTFSNFLIKNAPLYNFLANWLAHNKKMTEKSGKENRYRKFFCATLISTLGRFNRANKKQLCHIHFKLLFAIWAASVCLHFRPSVCSAA